MSFVVDSSVALAWCFEDEAGPITDDLLQKVVESGAVAPSLWPLEVLNALAIGEKRGRIDAEKRESLGGFLRDLPIDIDDETVHRAWSATAKLAARHQLTVYDATYLELAQRHGLPLATRDGALRKAATSIGVQLLGM